MSTVTNTYATIDRPVGLDYTPEGVKAYNPATDIPSNALDAKDFSSIDAWLDACIAQDKPGKIGSGDYEVSGLPRYAPKGIYGYGETPPTFIAEKTNTWLYLSDEKVTLKGLAFEGFGTVLGGAVPLEDGTPHHSETKADFKHYLPPEDGGTGLMLTVPASSSTVGPAIDISDCTFVDCRNAFTFVSDSTQMGKVDFNSNTLTGTWGMLDIDSLHWTEVNASNNDWGDAEQPNLKQNGYQTGFKIGTDHYVDLPGHFTKLSIENNYAHNITSIGSFDDTNAAVFIDVRSAESKEHGDNVIGYNKIVEVKGLMGQEDSNAIYAKAWGLIIEGNYLEDVGAAYVDAKRNGSETAGILVKPMTDGVAKNIEIIGNTLVDMPIPQGDKIDLSAIKLSEAIGNSSVSFNTLINAGNHSTAAGAGIIRIYSTLEHTQVIGNTFVDADIAPGSNAIVFHSTVRVGAAIVEVADNTAIKTSGAYSGDEKWINFTATPGKIIAGNNSLEGGYDMLLSKKATSVAGEYDAWTPDQVTPNRDTPVNHVIAVENLTPVAENTAAQTFIAKLTTMGFADTTTGKAGAILAATYTVDDARFVVKNGELYLKAGQALDYETASSIPVTITATTSKDVVQTIVDVAVKNVNEAATALTATSVAALTENTAVLTKVADLNVADPDAPGAFGAYTYDVSDARFVVQNGGLYLKAGQKVDFETEPKIAVKVTAHDGSATVQTTVNVTVKDVVEGGSGSGSGSTGGSTATPGVEGGKTTNNITGTSGDDKIVGTDKNDYIDGRDHLDTMSGGKGDDTYVISGYKDVIIEKAKEGVDTAIINDNRYFLSANVENAYAGAKVTSVTLVGNASDNILKGSAGNDILSGRGGNDYLIGGGGADVFVVTEGVKDVVADFGADDKLLLNGSDFADFNELKAAFKQVGADAVLTLSDASSITLKNVAVASLTTSMFDYDSLTKVATASAVATKTLGGTSADELIGGTTGKDLFNGKGGSDVMMGGLGDDTYTITSSNDRVIEKGKEGVDQVFVFSDLHRMDANVENAVVKTNSGSHIDGNASANIIIGGGGNDVLVGGGGADKLTGGGGSDTFTFHSLAEKGDTITDFQVGKDKLDVSGIMEGHSDYKFSFTQTSTGLNVYVDHGGVHDLLTTLTGVHQTIASDMVV